MEENLGRLQKSEMAGIVAHGFNSNKNIGIKQEVGTCVALFDNLAKIKINI